MKKNRSNSQRLAKFDYSQAGGYFVTICVKEKKVMFGEIVESEMHLNAIGRIVGNYWKWLEDQYSYLDLDEWIIMPNHMHGIIILHEHGRGGSRTALTKHPQRKSLGGIIGAFKTTSTKKVNLLRKSPGKSFWQRGYYDRIIRNRRELDRIRNYVSENPPKWELDEYYSK